MSRATRLLALLQALRERRGPVTAAALSKELEVSERTVYRDLSELTSQGAPIKGEAGLGFVLGPGLFLPPLMLTEAEIDAVLLGLRYVDQRGDEALVKAGAGARAKITLMLPRGLQTVVEAPLSAPGPNGGQFPENAVPLAILRSAIREQRRLAITYADEHDRPTERVIWPIQLGFTDTARVAIAWCELREAFRFFRTDRIQSAAALGRYPVRRANLLRSLHRDLQDANRRAPAPDRN